MTGLIFTCTFCGLLSTFEYHSAGPFSQLRKGEKSIKLTDLSAMGRPFKSAPYIRAAALLQELGKEEACKQLMILANKNDEKGQVTILCRLLFSKKGNKPFRAPLIGKPILIGGTSEKDWPLVPLEIVDNVPFFIIIVYELGGEPEPSLHYLKYCLENCEWSKTRYGQANDKTIEKALKKLLDSKKWKKPLTDYERQHLILQTKEAGKREERSKKGEAKWGHCEP